MKISKLFHWLYAILMLLPICGIFTKVGYVIFNKNAYQSYTGTYAYDSLEPSFTEDSLSVDLFNKDESLSYKGISNLFLGTFYFQGSNYSPSYTWGVAFPDISLLKTSLPIDDLSEIKSIHFSQYGNGSKVITFYDLNLNDTCISRIYGNYYDLNQDGTRIYPKYTFYISNSDISVINFISNVNYIYVTSYPDNAELTNINFIYTPYLSKLWSPTYVIDNTLSSVFYSSLQELDNTEFFSWAKDSFLVQPIMYIGNLFGITSPHPIFTLMSYWLAISIIWLVFDLVMYVPLLVHRWIDKGVIE